MNCSRVSFDFKADDVEQNFHLCFMVRVPWERLQFFHSLFYFSGTK
jgi:hypothetical protein